jgi:hypothetical protein
MTGRNVDELVTDLMRILPSGRINAELADNLQDQLGVSAHQFAFVVKRARARGELVLDTRLGAFNEQGFYRPATWDEFDRWRSEAAIPEMVALLDRLDKMSQRAQQLKGASCALR